MRVDRITILLVNAAHSVGADLFQKLAPYCNVYYTAMTQENRLEQLIQQFSINIIVFYIGSTIRHLTECSILLNKIGERAKILVITERANNSQFTYLLDTNISGLMFTDEVKDSFFYIIRAIHAGESWFSKGILHMQIQTATKLQTFYSDLHLTVQEMAILTYLVGGLKNGEIAYTLSLANSTVRNYVSKIYKKLNVSSRSELMQQLEDYGVCSALKISIKQK